MAVGTFYVVPRFGGWNGSTANNGSESSPYLHWWHVRAAMTAGDISPGSTIIYMGEYGPVTLAELTATDTWGQDIATITQALTWVNGSQLVTASNRQGGIVLGSSYTGSSNCRDMLIQFRGPQNALTGSYHIDGRGATTNAQRIRALMTIQGPRNRVEGLQGAQPDWNWMNTGRGVGQGLAGVGTYAQESSAENYGLIFWGGWGCQAYNCRVWGSNAFGRSGIEIRLAMLDTASQAASQSLIDQCDTWGQDRGQWIQLDGGLINGGLAFPQRFMPAAGAGAEIRNGRAWDSRWGDNLVTTAVNNSMFHGGHVQLGAGNWLLGPARISRMQTWGMCQDSIELVTGNAEVVDCEIGDLNPTWTIGGNFDRWVNSAGTWTLSANAVIGSGIKLGLGGVEGDLLGGTWPTLGVITGSSNLPAYRCRALRNSIRTTTGQPGAAGISTNGSNGTIIACNEMTGFDKSIIIAQTGLGAGDDQQHWVAHNYGDAGGICIDIVGNQNLWLWNNIFKGAGTDLSAFNALGGTIRGGNNRLVNGTSSYNLVTNAMRGNTSGAANYTAGIGPTVGGNCDTAGSWEGVFGAASSGVLRDKRGRAWGSAVPVGPYKP